EAAIAREAENDVVTHERIALLLACRGRLGHDGQRGDRRMDRREVRRGRTDDRDITRERRCRQDAQRDRVVEYTVDRPGRCRSAADAGGKRGRKRLEEAVRPGLRQILRIEAVTDLEVD